MGALAFASSARFLNFSSFSRRVASNGDPLPRRPAPRPTAPRFELGHVTAEGLASAFLGGTVGAVGSVVAIEAKRVKVKKSKQCPYCDGTGAIACAACLGTGLTDGEPCRLCGGRTVHTCENCKGRGRFIPTLLDARVSRDPETELEELGLQEGERKKTL